MNCAECRDNLVACAEGLLDRGVALECQSHLQACAACAVEYRAVSELREALLARGHAAAEIAMAESVMRRVLVQSTVKAKENTMSKLLKHRWGFGLSAAAGMAVLVLVLFLVFPKTQVTAAEVLARGARAVARLTSIHLRGELRTAPADNFGYINADSPFYPIELWKEFEPQLKWRIEKPGRVVVMNGDSTVMLIKSGDIGVKFPHRTTSAFDTEWLQRIANLSNTITNELRNAQAKGWKLGLAEENGADGRLKDVVTVLATPGVPEDDFLKNTFMQNADTRRVYTFDAGSGLLEAVQIYLVRPSGEVKIFDLSQIDYNQPIEASVWKLELPAEVTWAGLSVPKLPDNQKYASMSAEQAAQAFFQACSESNWTEAAKFMSPIPAEVKRALGGLQIISLGKAFTSRAYSGCFIPYEIKLTAQEFNVRVSSENPARRYVITGLLDDQLRLEQDVDWTNPPAVLAPNDADGSLSPAEAVKTYFAAMTRTNWDEMRKFAPAYDVARDKARIEAALKSGAELAAIVPKVQVGEAVWSAQQNAWLVKCQIVQVKKWNLALRKDNPAGRWQVDGGI